MIRGEAEDLLMRIGHEFWRMTYGSGMKQVAATEAMLQHMAATGSLNDSETTQAIDASRHIFALEWINAGCVTLTTGHRFAAALAVNRPIAKDLLCDIKAPATAFRVELPSGLLSNDEFGHAFSQANVYVLENGTGCIILEGSGRPRRTKDRTLAAIPMFVSSTPGETLADLLFDREPDSDIWVQDSDVMSQQGPEEIESKHRIVLLAKRIVAGLLLAYTHTAHWKQLGRGGHKHEPTRTGPPPHRVIFVGKPINLDARTAVAAYIGSGRGAPPSVQTLVRGHHKRQVIGVGRSGRKVVWIEPYWRGPEDAPILTHPYQVGSGP